MTATLSIRDLARSGKALTEYDYVDIEDRKSHEYKGVFVSKRYAEDVKKFLEEKMKKERQELLEKVMRFSGILDGDTEGKSFQELKSEKDSVR